MLRTACLTWSVLLVACFARAQQGGSQPPTVPSQQGWTWTGDARAFIGLNYQRRKFTDFNKWESQNWLMGEGKRQTGTGTLALSAMLSLEPFTMQKLGSPQVFQTGETYRQAPLIDYQHPHDLFMGLGASYARPIGSFTSIVEADLVGSPSLGPAPSMHRPSAEENPEVPLSHHNLDSTHSTPGVLRAGLQRNGIGVDGSWFRGQEPDENRTDLDLGALDSWALRASWKGGAWSAQVSGAHLTKPEYVEPYYDATRLTASVGYTRMAGDRQLATFAAWGENREIHGILDAYLLESTVRWNQHDAAYLRAELVAKSILDAGGRHPRGFLHPHRISRVGALTLGYVRNLRASATPRFGLGAHVTMYYVPPKLKDNYGAPLSFHLFVRYNAGSAAHLHTP